MTASAASASSATRDTAGANHEDARSKGSSGCANVTSSARSFGSATNASANTSAPVSASARPSLPDGGHEIGFEVFYKVQLTPWCYVQPGFEWIGSPGGGDTSPLEDDVIGYLLVGVEF